MLEKTQKSAYELSQSQVTTPQDVVSLFWKLTHRRRANLGTVLDMGCGDARFAHQGKFRKYVGVEIDESKSRVASAIPHGKILTGCVFRHKSKNYDACIGNPPYVRHHFVESEWKQATINRIRRDLGFTLNGHSNLYLYFVCLGLIKTKDKGLLSLVIPYEWVSRPSAEAIRSHIIEQGWNVHVYRFSNPIFKNVLTTASISIIDKAGTSGTWTYFDIDAHKRLIERKSETKSGRKVLKYSNRGTIWALRGLSPGSQEIFTLTEGERIHNGLSKKDVVPCVTTLKHVPPDLRVLTRSNFHELFVERGARCWLVRSDKKKIRPSLAAYLESVPEEKRDNFTCRNQQPWFRYQPHPAPKLLISSGFVKFGPKVLINEVGAVGVGSAFGIHSDSEIQKHKLQRYLLSINFENQVVPHAKTLKKVEVKQINTVLLSFSKRVKRDRAKDS